MIVRDVFCVRGHPVLVMHLDGREPSPGDTVRKVGSSDSWRVLGVERNRRFGELRQGEPLGLMVPRECPYGAGDDVETIAQGT